MGQDRHLPPHSYDTEEALLAACLNWPDTFYDIADIVTAEDFYTEAHRNVFEAIPRVLEAGQLDIITLSNAVDSKPVPRGGDSWVAYFINLQSDYAVAGGGKQYAAKIAEMSTRRKLIASAGEIATKAWDIEEEIAGVISSAEQSIFDVRNKKMTQVSTPDIYTNNFLANFDRLIENGEVAGVKTGFKDIDKLLNGLQAPQLHVLAARPGMGKSTMALNIAENIVANGGTVLLFSLEMSETQIMTRRIANHTGIRIDKLGRPWELTADEVAMVRTATAELKNRMLLVDTKGGLTPSEMRAKAMRVYNRYGLDLIVIDHLVLMRPDRVMKRTDIEYGEMTMSIFETSKLIGCPTLLLTQLNRGVESRQDKRPLLSDLRESGRIEENAFSVMFLYRDDYYNEFSETPNMTEFLIRKNREGATGRVDLYNDLSVARFADMVRREINL